MCIRDSLYVADANNHLIRKISSAGGVTTFAGSGREDFKDGTGTEAQFDDPFSVAVDSSGILYVADRDNNRIRKIIISTKVVTTIAGDGTAATFNSPHGVAVDSSGNVYVADTGNDRIRKITPTGVVSTLAGSCLLYTSPSPRD